MLIWSQQINNICYFAYFYLRTIGEICRFLGQKATEFIVHAFITSQQDNRNSLLYRLPKNQAGRLQKIQNQGARIILQVHKYDHISMHIESLHWLPVRQG